MSFVPQIFAQLLYKDLRLQSYLHAYASLKIEVGFQTIDHLETQQLVSNLCGVEFNFFFFLTYLFIYFWLCWVFIAARRLLIAVASLVAEHRLQASRLQKLWLAGSRAQAPQLWLTILVAPQHVGSSLTRARTRVACIGRRILNHCATREAPQLNFLKAKFSCSTYSLHPRVQILLCAAPHLSQSLLSLSTVLSGNLFS